MISAIIIDDELNNSNYLKGLIEEQVPEIKLRGQASTVQEGLHLIQQMSPELVFLDVELDNETGFDLLGKLEKINFAVIFTTAHERYALKAIKFAALDFLLKPIDPEELKLAVAKVIKHKNEKLFEQSMSVLLDNLSNRNQNQKIAISLSNGITVIEIRDILYCSSDGPYTTIYTKKEKILSSRHLKEYESLLTEHRFFRVHRSFLVNLDEIKQFSPHSNGSYLIVSNGAKVDVSDRKRAELREKLASGVIFLS